MLETHAKTLLCPFKLNAPDTGNPNCEGQKCYSWDRGLMLPVYTKKILWFKSITDWKYPKPAEGWCSLISEK